MTATVSSSRIVPSPNAFAIEPVESLGLILRLHGGYVVGGAAWQLVPTTTIVLPDNAMSYIEVSTTGQIVSNTTMFSAGAVFLYAVTTLNGVVVSIADWRSSPGIPSTGVTVDVLKATVTLTHQQILTLPTTAVPVLAAPGAGKVLLPIACILAFNLVAEYTNVGDSAGTGLNVVYGVVSGPSSAFVIAWFQQTNYTLFGSGIAQYTATNGFRGDGNGGGGLFAPGGQDYRNKGISVGAKNESNSVALGNFTGGDAANTLSATVVYCVIDA